MKAWTDIWLGISRKAPMNKCKQGSQVFIQTEKSNRGLNDLFVENNEVHTYSTRQSKLLHVQKANTSAAKKTIRYIGTSMWNRISNILDYNCSMYIYKQRVKNYLLSNEICQILDLLLVLFSLYLNTESICSNIFLLGHVHFVLLCYQYVIFILY